MKVFGRLIQLLLCVIYLPIVAWAEEEPQPIYVGPPEIVIPKTFFEEYNVPDSSQAGNEEAVTPISEE